MINNLALIFDCKRGEIKYNSSDHAFIEKGKNALVEVKIPRYFGVEKVVLQIYSDKTGEKYDVVGEWSDTLFKEDVYSFDLTSLNLAEGLYFFDLISYSGVSTIYLERSGRSTQFTNTKPDTHQFQLTVADFKFKSPSRYLGGVIYHVFVDRFSRGEDGIYAEDQILVEDWSEGIPEFPKYPGAPLKNNTFFGGTLIGIAKRLDYLVSLGVSLIYLSPIFLSPSNHKYDTADYFKVDPCFGGDKGLIYLIKEAEKRGIGIILDGVFNHTGSDSIYFNKYSRFPSIGAYESRESQYYSWYDFQSHPNEYTSWWGIDILPRINTDKKECRDFFVSARGVIQKYVSLGVLGYRLDVADELSDSFIRDIKKCMEKKKSPCLLYGEVWEDASNKIAYGRRKEYYLGSELDGVMNYPIREGIIAYLTGCGIEKLQYALETVIFNAPKRIADANMNLLGSHDTARILTALSGKSSEGYTNEELRVLKLNTSEYSRAFKRLLMAYTILATIPGIPSIYYGDEAGLEGYGDPFNRMPYPWGKENADLLSHFRKINAIRRNNSIYRSGDFDLHVLTDDLLIFSRCDSKDRFFTVINNSGEPLNISFDKDAFSLYQKEEYKGREEIQIQSHSFDIISSSKTEEITIY